MNAWCARGIAIAIWASGAVVAETTLPSITWSRTAASIQPTALVLLPGQVVLTRVANPEPVGPTPTELATTLAAQQNTLQELAAQQRLTLQDAKEYASLQAKLARAEAEKAALAQNTAAQVALANQQRELRTLAAQQVADTAGVREYASLQAKLARAEAEKNAIFQSITASTQHIATQAAATEARLRAQTTTENKQLASQVASQMQGYTQGQIANANRQTQAALAAQSATIQQQIAAVSASQLQPNQVAAIASTQAAQQIVAAQPQFQALAFNTLSNAKPYLKTIARNAVAEGDPAMQQALSTAFGKALAEENSPAAFRMRKAIVNELAAATQGTISGTETTKLGNDIEPAAGIHGAEIALDASRLRLARLLAPGSTGAEPGTEVTTELANLTPQPSPAATGASLQRARTRTDLMNLRDYKVVVHDDGKTLPEMLTKIILHAEPFTGPWQVKWKLSTENQDLLTEKFSLDVETSFADFVSYLAQYLLNDRGVKLSFSLFDRERVVLVSD